VYALPFSTLISSLSTHQPGETLRSMTEARRLLEEAREEIKENRERAQLRPSHTFSRLPGFFPRPSEMQAVERTLEEEPCFTVLFGASSVGKVRANFTEAAEAEIFTLTISSEDCAPSTTSLIREVSRLAF
jgi:hypothetical protein